MKTHHHRRSTDYIETADGYHLAPLCTCGDNLTECNEGHIYCAACEIDPCDIPL